MLTSIKLEDISALKAYDSQIEKSRQAGDINNGILFRKNACPFGISSQPSFSRITMS